MNMVSKQAKKFQRKRESQARDISLSWWSHEIFLWLSNLGERHKEPTKKERKRTKPHSTKTIKEQ